MRWVVNFCFLGGEYERRCEWRCLLVRDVFFFEIYKMVVKKWWWKIEKEGKIWVL